MNNFSKPRASFGPKVISKPEISKQHFHKKRESDAGVNKIKNCTKNKAIYISLRDLKTERKEKSRSQSRQKIDILQRDSENLPINCFEKIMSTEEKWLLIKESLNSTRPLTRSPSSPKIISLFSIPEAECNKIKSRSSSTEKKIKRKFACVRMSYQFQKEGQDRQTSRKNLRKNSENVDDSSEILKLKPNKIPINKPFCKSRKSNSIICKKHSLGLNSSLNSCKLKTPPKSPKNSEPLLLFSKTGGETVQKLIKIAKKLKSDLEKDSPAKPIENSPSKIQRKCIIGPKPISEKIVRGLKNEDSEIKVTKIRVLSLNEQKNLFTQTMNQPIQNPNIRYDFLKTQHLNGVSKLMQSPGDCSISIIKNSENIESKIKTPSKSKQNIRKNPRKTPQRLHTETRNFHNNGMPRKQLTQCKPKGIFSKAECIY